MQQVLSLFTVTWAWWGNLNQILGIRGTGPTRRRSTCEKIVREPKWSSQTSLLSTLTQILQPLISLFHCLSQTSLLSTPVCQTLSPLPYSLWCSVPLFPFSLSSTITLGLLLLHFGSHTIFFTCRSPPGRTSTTWLVVLGRDHRNCAHAIKVWRIYIHTYKRKLTTLHD